MSPPKPPEPPKVITPPEEAMKRADRLCNIRAGGVDEQGQIARQGYKDLRIKLDSPKPKTAQKAKAIGLNIPG